jgi:hypothetical protein
MSKEIIYSFKEYQEKYTPSLEKYFLEYEEIEEIDFVINEIEKYTICLQIINFPIGVAFSWFFRIEYGINLKTFCVPQETFDFIFANENADYYYKIYNDLIDPVTKNHSLKEDCERKVKQTRLIFPKIISFLQNKKTALENNLDPTTQQPYPIDLPEKSGVEKNRIIIKEPYGEIFSNNGFELFEYILNECVKPKEKIGRKSDLIYFYWEMYNSKPQYIHQRPAPFFEWYEEKYNETTGQLKTYDNVKTDQRIKDYSTALEWFKLKEK